MKSVVAFVVLFGAGLLWLTLVIGSAYVALHFILKYW